MEMLSLNCISKSYGTHQVLQNVTLSVRRGEIYGLIGKNGAGKTTIFKVILGLTEFDKGQLSISGSTSKASLPKHRKEIGFFIGTNFFGYLNAKENLDYYRRMKGTKDKNEVNRVLKLVNLDEVNAKFCSFSMGMKQRLGIANALLGNPQILILDEPINGLDPQGIADIRHLITRLNQEFGITIIVSSHILSELEHTASRFGIIDRGRILKEVAQEDLRLRNDKIEIQTDDYEKAKQVLHQNHIQILRTTSAYQSLEDYYFKLVGGKIDE